MRYEQEREETGATTKLTYLLIGGGIGAILALLFAPKSGEELRGDIADATRKGLEKSKEAAALAKERAGEYYEVTRERAGELYSTAQEKVGSAYQTAQEKAGELAERAKKRGEQHDQSDFGGVRSRKEAYEQEKRRGESKAITEGRPTYPVENKEG